ncbi:SNF2 super family, partial [Reticulomyxa filosa]
SVIKYTRIKQTTKIVTYEVTVFVKMLKSVQRYSHIGFKNIVMHGRPSPLQEFCKKAITFQSQNKKRAKLAYPGKNLGKILNLACRYSTSEEEGLLQIRADRLNISLPLQPYQVQTVQWMYTRELHRNGVFGDLFERSEFANGIGYYYSPYLDRIWLSPLPNVWGGIVAEEMGLGKTIEAIALVQLHPRPASQLTCCFTKRRGGNAAVLQRSKGNKKKEAEEEEEEEEEGKYLPIKGTLIIAPPSLVGQWEEEINHKCTSPLSVYTYHGGNRAQDPRQLSEFDVENTRKGVLHQCQWWRVIVDEGHALKDGKTGQSRGILELKAVNKWILTGTPFNTSFHDIKNQFKFLGLSFCDSNWWTIVSRGFNRCKSADLVFVNEFFTMFCYYFFFKKKKKTLLFVTMRHVKSQKFDGVKMVSLPKKHEITIGIEFTTEQKEWYDKLYQVAVNRYQCLKSKPGHNIRSDYFVL